MQTTARETPGVTFTPQLAMSRSDAVMITLQCLSLATVLLGGPVVAASVGGTDLSIVVATALLVAVVAGIWRLGTEFERAWSCSDHGPLLGDERGRAVAVVATERPSFEVRVGRPSEFVGAGAARTPAR